ncbi:phosphopyruvate hydratase [Patescibacteria group bacterium]
MKIDKIQAYEILDSRGTPTVEVELVSGKNVASASVPSGASTGTYEAVELRDGDENRYNGKGVFKAVKNVNEIIAKKIVGENISSQKKLDKLLIELDGAENKSNLGANAILGVSLAFAKAMAKKKNIELYEYFGSLDKKGEIKFNLPTPSFNVINGGKHSDSGLDIQEFMIQPIGIPDFREKVRVGVEIYNILKQSLVDKGEVISVGDEGGFAPRLKSNEDAFELLVKAIEKAGYSFDQVKIGIDVAANSFYENGKYNKMNYKGERELLNTKEMIEWYSGLINRYPIHFIEDGFDENDWKGFILFNEKFGDKIINVGDDLLVTNIKRVKIAIRKKAVNAVVIKLNQIGTITETIKTIQLTKSQGWTACVAHRSGETEDNYIADLAVGCNCEFIKAGAPCRSERTAKYNRLMKIAEGLV